MLSHTENAVTLLLWSEKLEGFSQQLNAQVVVTISAWEEKKNQLRPNEALCVVYRQE